MNLASNRVAFGVLLIERKIGLDGRHLQLRVAYSLLQTDVWTVVFTLLLDVDRWLHCGGGYCYNLLRLDRGRLQCCHRWH